MELRQLEYLVAVVEEANFTRAAERTRVSQSGISAQIRALEREVGLELVDRSGRTVTATDAGAAMLPYARAALSSVASAQSAIREINGLTSGRVSIGMVTACAIPTLFELTAEFHDAYPGVDVSLAEDTSDRLITGVLDGTFDLALVGVSGPATAGLHTVLVIDEAIVAAVPAVHRLASTASISVAELTALPILTMPVGTGIRGALDAACAAVHRKPRIAVEASTGGAIVRLAAQGLGVAVLSASMALASELVTIRIDDPAARSRIEFAWPAHAQRSPAAAALIATLRARSRLL